jgi:hypothetical protein
VDRACFAASAVARKGSFQDDEGTWAEAGVGEDLAEVGWSAEIEEVLTMSFDNS